MENEQPIIIEDVGVIEVENASESIPEIPAAGAFEDNEAMDVSISNENSLEEQNDTSSQDDIDASSTCTICYSKYTNSGEHRLCCLKCGHIFGHNCILHWLKAVCTSANRKCPTCNEKAAPQDVRILYAKTLIALDTSERDSLKAEFEKTKQEKTKLESMLNQSNTKISVLQEEIKTLEAALKQMSKRFPVDTIRSVNSNYTFSCSVETTIKLAEKGCRVLTSSSRLSLLLASQESPNPLFPGFGIRKINMCDLKATQYQTNLHKKEIRDMEFSHHDTGSLLTVSLDCTAKLFDVQSNVAVQTLTVSEPLWACCWNTQDANKFFCGSQKGTIYIFDRRYGSEPEQVIELPESKTGVLSLCYVSPKGGRFMPNGGILACRLTNVVSVYQSSSIYETTVLPIEGNFLSMRYNETTDNVLISARPSKNFASPRHLVGQLSKVKPGGSRNTFDVVNTFYGARCPRVLSRSAIVPTPKGDELVCAYNDRDTTIDAWSLISEKKLNTQNVLLAEPILDICSFPKDDNCIFIPCLSESKLSIVNFELHSNNS